MSETCSLRCCCKFTLCLELTKTMQQFPKYFFANTPIVVFCPLFFPLDAAGFDQSNVCMKELEPVHLGMYIHGHLSNWEAFLPTSKGNRHDTDDLGKEGAELPVEFPTLLPGRHRCGNDLQAFEGSPSATSRPSLGL